MYKDEVVVKEHVSMFGKLLVEQQLSAPFVSKVYLRQTKNPVQLLSSNTLTLHTILAIKRSTFLTYKSNTMENETI